MLTPWGEVAVADAHVHFVWRRFFSAMGAQCGKSAEEVAQTLGWALPPEDPAELARTWVGELDAQGVARAAIIASVPGDEASVEAAVNAGGGRLFGSFMVNPLEPGAPERVALALRCGFHPPLPFPSAACYA